LHPAHPGKSHFFSDLKYTVIFNSGSFSASMWSTFVVFPIGHTNSVVMLSRPQNVNMSKYNKKFLIEKVIGGTENEV
jgi:hypothetical protein